MSGIGGWIDGWGEGRGAATLVRMSRGMRRGDELRREAYLTGSLGIFSHVVGKGEGLGFGDGFVAAWEGKIGENSAEIMRRYGKARERVAEGLCGSFALGVGDEKRGELILARGDELSPPLYYTRDEGRLLFATEIQGILAVSEGAERVARTRLLAHLSAPVGTFPPESFYEGIRALPAGHTLVADRLGMRVFAHHTPKWEKEGDEVLGVGALLPDEGALDAALHEGLEAFECPAFDHAMPAYLAAVRQGGREWVTVEDETLFWNLEYAHERAARLGARLGVRICPVPPGAPSGRGRELKQMEALLRARLTKADPYLLSYLFEGRQEALIGGEKRIETRIRRLGLMLQAVEWSHRVAIL